MAEKDEPPQVTAHTPPQAVSPTETDHGFYRDLHAKIESEGIGYYIQCYTDGHEFKFDKELYEAFQQANYWLNRFDHLVKTRVVQECKKHGDDPMDYDWYREDEAVKQVKVRLKRQKRLKGHANE